MMALVAVLVDLCIQAVTHSHHQPTMYQLVLAVQELQARYALLVIAVEILPLVPISPMAVAVADLLPVHVTVIVGSVEALVVAAVLDPEPQLDLQAIHLVAISVVMANQLVPMSVHIVTSVRVVVAHQVREAAQVELLGVGHLQIQLALLVQEVQLALVVTLVTEM